MKDVNLKFVNMRDVISDTEYLKGDLERALNEVDIQVPDFSMALSREYAQLANDIFNQMKTTYDSDIGWYSERKLVHSYIEGMSAKIGRDEDKNIVVGIYADDKQWMTEISSLVTDFGIKYIHV